MNFYFAVFGAVCFISGWQFAELRARGHLENYFLDVNDLEEIFQNSLAEPRRNKASFAYFGRDWLDAWEDIDPELLEHFLDTKIIEGTGFKHGDMYIFPTGLNQ